MACMSVNDTLLHYETLGAGPPCLVRHGGLGLDHSYLRPAIDRLADRPELAYYDHRGNGRSGRPPLGTLSIEQLAEDADALAARLAYEEVLVLGASLRGLATYLVLRRARALPRRRWRVARPARPAARPDVDRKVNSRRMPCTT